MKNLFGTLDLIIIFAWGEHSMNLSLTHVSRYKTIGNITFYAAGTYRQENHSTTTSRSHIKKEVLTKTFTKLNIAYHKLVEVLGREAVLYHTLIHVTLSFFITRLAFDNFGIAGAAVASSGADGYTKTKDSFIPRYYGSEHLMKLMVQVDSNLSDLTHELFHLYMQPNDFQSYAFKEGHAHSILG
jgi:hypothetical protein